MRNIIYKERELEGERLDLTAKDGNYYLGPELTLRRCTVVVGVSSKWLFLRQTRFLDCTIDIKQELKNLSWALTYLRGCRVTGRLSGCDFGRWHGAYPTEHSGIEDCDFTGARLDGCRFHDCDPGTLRLPTWPCFTLLDPVGHQKQLQCVQWPGLFGEVIIDDLHERPASTSALTYHAPSLARRMKTTAEALMPLLQQFDFIRL